MQVNKYIGDEAFNKMLDHYNCPTPLDVIKMRFAGAVCSPNLQLRPTDVISSFWLEGREPRLQTKDEADLFFKFFMGLWDEIFEDIKNNSLKLPVIDNKNLSQFCLSRFDEIEQGFLEGFFGGKEDLKMPNYLAQIIDSLSELAIAYQKIYDHKETSAKAKSTATHLDKVVVRSIAFIVENSVLPRIEELKRTVN